MKSTLQVATHPTDQHVDEFVQYHPPEEESNECVQVNKLECCLKVCNYSIESPTFCLCHDS